MAGVGLGRVKRFLAGRMPSDCVRIARRSRSEQIPESVGFGLRRFVNLADLASGGARAARTGGHVYPVIAANSFSTPTMLMTRVRL